MYLALWLIRRWRLPATPCFTLPVAVSLKRFFTPLLVFSLGILSPLPPQGADIWEQPRQPFWPGGSILPQAGKEAPLEKDGREGKMWGGEQALGVGMISSPLPLWERVAQS